MKPDVLIAAFDQVVAFYWGAPREFVNRHDKKTAQAWIDAGADTVICTIVFAHQLRRMFEKEMTPPTSLAIVNDDILAAITRAQGKHLEDWEKELSLWDARVKNWIKNPSWWLPNQWGPNPDHPANRVPAQVLKKNNLGAATRVKQARTP